MSKDQSKPAADRTMITPECTAKTTSPNEMLPPAESRSAPWQNLTTRIREALAQRSFYVASSQDLSMLWRGERIDALERRRRIMVFAAQHHWKVDTRADGRAARFRGTPSAASPPRESLSRNHE